MKKPANHTSAFVLLVGALGACGGGGGGGGGNAGPGPTPPVVNLKPGGIYHGMVTGCSVVCPVDAIVLVAEDGEWVAMDPQYAAGANVGQITMNGSSFDDPRRFYDGSPRAYGFRPMLPASVNTPNDFRTFEGEIVERVSIEGVMPHNTSRNTMLAASYDPIYENDSSLAIITGTYSVADTTGFTLTYSIDSNGVLSGSDTDGCLVAGDVAIIDPNYNMYRFDIDFSSCGANGAQGGYSGIGALIDSGGGAESLLFYAVADDDIRLVILNLPKL